MNLNSAIDFFWHWKSAVAILKINHCQLISSKIEQIHPLSLVLNFLPELQLILILD